MQIRIDQHTLKEICANHYPAGDPSVEQSPTVYSQKASRDSRHINVESVQCLDFFPIQLRARSITLTTVIPEDQTRKNMFTTVRPPVASLVPPWLDGLQCAPLSCMCGLKFRQTRIIAAYCMSRLVPPGGLRALGTRACAGTCACTCAFAMFPFLLLRYTCVLSPLEWVFFFLSHWISPNNTLFEFNNVWHCP